MNISAVFEIILRKEKQVGFAEAYKMSWSVAVVTPDRMEKKSTWSTCPGDT